MQEKEETEKAEFKFWAYHACKEVGIDKNNKPNQSG